MITGAWGNWSLFQSLLSVLRRIGDRHGGVSISNVATRWVLDRPAVGAVIVGTRLGVSSNVESNLNTFSLRLDEEDTNSLNELALTRAAKVYQIMGDCGSEYRKSPKRES